MTFLSDFGRRDIFVGVCHAVIAERAPHARVIDLTHEVSPGDVPEGATLLARAVPHVPVAVHLAVVDPGVGGRRRGIAVRTRRGDLLVGPDNGLLLPAAEALGGPDAVHELVAEHHRRRPTSRTFHGRDVFAPAAAALADGIELDDLGPPVDDPVVPRAPHLVVGAERLEAEVVLVDRFGNVQLAADGDALDAVDRGEDRLVVSAAGRAHRARRVRTFADLEVGDLGIYEDSDAYVALTVREGSARDRLDVARGDIVAVERAP